MSQKRATYNLDEIRIFLKISILITLLTFRINDRDMSGCLASTEWTKDNVYCILNHFNWLQLRLNKMIRRHIAYSKLKNVLLPKHF